MTQHLGSGLLIASFSLGLLLSFQNCSPARFESFSEESLASKASTCDANQVVDLAGNCISATDVEKACTFNGQIIANGTDLMFFQSPTVPSGSTCIQEIRHCLKGSLSGSFGFLTCKALPATPTPTPTSIPGPLKNCTFNGTTVLNGATVTAWLEAQSKMCKSEVRKCTDGVLSGSYPQSSCQSLPPDVCFFNGTRVESGQTVDAFNVNAATAVSDCKSEKRLCTDGNLAGTYVFPRCAPDVKPRACSFNGMQIESGQSVPAFNVQNGTEANDCKSETRVCNDGSLSGSFSFASCKPYEKPSCDPNEIITASHSFFVTVQASRDEVAHVCNDPGSDWHTSLPNDEGSTIRFMNTCSHRYCASRGYVSGRATEMGDQVIMVCQTNQIPATVSDPCKQKLAQVAKPIEIVSVSDGDLATACIDSLNQTVPENLPSNQNKLIRWIYTCGNRYCRQNNQHYAGRVIEMGGGLNYLACSNNELLNNDPNISTFFNQINTTTTAIGTACSENGSSPESSFPGTALNTLRYVTTCGNRFCQQHGYSNGWSSEYYQDDSSAICIK